MCRSCGRKLVKVKCEACNKIFFARRDAESVTCVCGNKVY